MHFMFMGSSGAVPSAARDTTSLLFVGDAGAILVDCGGSPVQKLRRAGLDPLDLTHVVITHIHPDHAYGLPALVQSLFLLGRRQPLAVLCRPEHVAPLRTILDVFELWQRPGVFPLTLDAISLQEGAAAVRGGSLTLSTAPNEHGRMPNFAVRVDVTAGTSVVYSSDTGPCAAVARLATGADTLIHEATFPERDRGRFGAHSTAEDAGRVAAQAGVRRLILTHVEADYHEDLPTLAEEAGRHFSGVVEIARELEPYALAHHPTPRDRPRSRSAGPGSAPA